MKKAATVFIILSIIASGIVLFYGVVMFLSILPGVQTDMFGFSISMQILGIYLSLVSIVPIVVGFIALTKLETVTRKDDIILISIFTLLMCSLIAGVLMLCMSNDDFAKK